MSCKTRLVNKLIKLKKEPKKIYLISFPCQEATGSIMRREILKFNLVKVIASGKGGDPPSLSPPTYAIFSIKR